MAESLRIALLIESSSRIWAGIVSRDCGLFARTWALALLPARADDGKPLAGGSQALASRWDSCSYSRKETRPTASVRHESPDGGPIS